MRQQLRHHVPSFCLIGNGEILGLSGISIFRFVCLPNAAPSLGAGFRVVEWFQNAGITKNLIKQPNNFGATPVGFSFLSRRRFSQAALILIGNMVQQPRISAAPLVDGLLLVTDAEKCSLTTGILNHFID